MEKKEGSSPEESFIGRIRFKLPNSTEKVALQDDENVTKTVVSLNFIRTHIAKCKKTIHGYNKDIEFLHGFIQKSENKREECILSLKSCNDPNESIKLEFIIKLIDELVAEAKIDLIELERKRNELTKQQNVCEDVLRAFEESQQDGNR